MEIVILTCSPNSSTALAHCLLVGVSLGSTYFSTGFVISGFGVAEGKTKERFERKKGGLLWEKRVAFLIKDKIAKWG